MKSAHERAILIAWDASGKSFSVETFKVMLKDESETGKNIRSLVEAIERGIETDRAEYARSIAPS